MRDKVTTDNAAGMVAIHPSRQAAVLATLLETSVAITAASSLDIDTLLARIFTAIERLVPVDRGSIVMDIPGRDMLRIACVRGDATYAARMLGQERPIAGSITGRVYREATPLLIDDMFAPEWQRNIYEIVKHPDRFAEIRSSVFVPLIAGKTVGVIFLGRRGVGKFSQEDLAILQLFAPQAAIAITNARQYAATRVQAEGLQALLVASERFAAYTATHDADPVTDFGRLVATQARHIVPHQRTAISRYDAGTDTTKTLVYLRGDTFHTPSGVFHARSGLTGAAIAAGEPLLVNESQHDPRSIYFHGEDRATLREHIIIVPLIVAGRVTGAISVIRRDTPPFTDEEFARVQLFARHAAAGIERVQFTATLQERNTALVAANRGKDAFLTNMSHELRTPLNAVIGFAQLLADGVVRDDTDRQAAYDDILGSGTHLLMMVNDILDVARIESGQQTVTLTPLDVRSEIHAAERIVASLIAQKHQTLTLVVPDTVPQVHADRDRLRQVLLNLLSNAHKFTPVGGAITVVVSEVPGTESLTIQVRDTGIGIAPEHHAAVFEAFRQVESGYTRAQQGTGLGLTLTKQLVERMGGTITLASTPGVGSVFTVTLPTARE